MARARGAEIPKVGRELLPKVTKVDLLEVAWDLAALANEAGSVDDEASTAAKLREMLATRKASRK